MQKGKMVVWEGPTNWQKKKKEEEEEEEEEEEKQKAKEKKKDISIWMQSSKE